jgi:cytochrome c5
MNNRKHIIVNLLAVILTVLFLSACAIFATPVAVNNPVATTAPVLTTAPADTVQPASTSASAPTTMAATDTPATAATLDGKTLLEQRCNACHSLEYIYRSRGTPDQWAMLVQQMVANGAQLNQQEEKVLAQYLGQTYSQ